MLIHKGGDKFDWISVFSAHVQGSCLGQGGHLGQLVLHNAMEGLFEEDMASSFTMLWNMDIARCDNTGSCTSSCNMGPIVGQYRESMHWECMKQLNILEARLFFDTIFANQVNAQCP